MEHYSYWFPPSREDLDKPFDLIQEASKDLERALKVWEKLKKYVSTFPSVGPERAKTELAHVIDNHMRMMAKYQEELHMLVEKQHLMEGLVELAFHEPLKRDPMPAYASYDRRR